MNGVYSSATPKADIHLSRKIVPFQKDDLQKSALQLLNTNFFYRRIQRAWKQNNKLQIF